MALDTVVWGASFVKLTTAIAALQLIERGDATLDDPELISRILPEVANARIVNRENGVYQYRSPKNRVTLRMLLNHTAGFSYSVSFILIVHILFISSIADVQS